MDLFLKRDLGETKTYVSRIQKFFSNADILKNF